MPPAVTRGRTSIVMPTSRRSIVVNGVSVLPSVAKLPVRKGTFWPTTMVAGRSASVVIDGVDSRFACVDCDSACTRTPKGSRPSPSVAPGVRAPAPLTPRAETIDAIELPEVLKLVAANPPDGIPSPSPSCTPSRSATSPDTSTMAASIIT